MYLSNLTLCCCEILTAEGVRQPLCFKHNNCDTLTSFVFITTKHYLSLQHTGNGSPRQNGRGTMAGSRRQQAASRKPRTEEQP